MPQLQPKLYRYSDEQAVRHLFRVASSLDSMILGEPQILGQIKSCYNAASDVRTIGTYLNNLLQAAFRTAKRVRSETSIGEYPVSVSSAAVELVRKIFGDLQKSKHSDRGRGKDGGSCHSSPGGNRSRSRFMSPIAAPKPPGNSPRSFAGPPFPSTNCANGFPASDIVHHLDRAHRRH